MSRVNIATALSGLFGLGMLGVGGLVASPANAFALGTSAAASQQNSIVPVRFGQSGLTNCNQRNDALGTTPSHIKGATSSRPWKLFDQRSAFFPIRSQNVVAPSVPGGRARQIKLDRREVNAHIIGVSMLNQRPISSGSIVEARVWIRATSAPQTTLVARLQNNEPGFKRLTETPLTITNTFQEYVVRTQAYQNYCPGTFNFALHLATGPHTFEIGPGLLIVQENPLVS